VRFCLVFAALAAIGCNGARSASSDDDSPRAGEFRSPSVTHAMDAASELVRTRGFAASTPMWRGFLVEHGSDIREQSLRTGTCTVVLGAGSRSIRELDLKVFDSDGGEIVQDATSGPLAALRFCPSQSGTYYIAVHASAGNGLFEVRSFRGPTGLEIRIDDVFREVAPPEPPTEEE
jgi:hypothetical protein